ALPFYNGSDEGLFASFSQLHFASDTTLTFDSTQGNFNEIFTGVLVGEVSISGGNIQPVTLNSFSLIPQEYPLGTLVLVGNNLVEAPFIGLKAVSLLGNTTFVMEEFISTLNFNSDVTATVTSGFTLFIGDIYNQTGNGPAGTLNIEEAFFVAFGDM